MRYSGNIWRSFTHVFGEMAVLFRIKPAKMIEWRSFTVITKFIPGKHLLFDHQISRYMVCDIRPCDIEGIRSWDKQERSCDTYVTATKLQMDLKYIPGSTD